MTDDKLFFKCFSFGLHFSLKNENYIFNSFTVCKTVKKKEHNVRNVVYLISLRTRLIGLIASDIATVISIKYLSDINQWLDHP